MPPLFTQKDLNIDQGTGEQLRQARNLKKISISEAAAKTGIKESYLLDLENENYDNLPSGLYIKNFLKRYAKFLGINHSEIIKKSRLKNNYPETDPFFKKILAPKNFLVFPKLIRNILLIIVLIICFLYLSFYLLRATKAPELIIIQPETDLITEQREILIIGSTDKDASITINGELIISDNQGSFSSWVNLKQGVNEIIISAQKKHSREKIIHRQILVK